MMKNLIKFLLLSSIIFSGCSDSNNNKNGMTEETIQKTTNSLDQNRITWEENAPENYELTYFRICECAPYETKAIINNSIVSSAQIKISEAGEFQNVAEDDLDSILTVEGFFQEIEDQIGNVDVLYVDFDEELGYPVEIEIDPEAENCDGGVCTVVMDDEILYNIVLEIIKLN